MTLIPLLSLGGCLKVEAVPVADAGAPDGAATPDLGALNPDMGEVDPTANWPALAHDFGREITQIYPCENALLWTFAATRDDVDNRRNDGEVWAWEVGGSPQVLAANLRPLFGGLAGCHEGSAYWSETDGDAVVLYRRSMSGGTAAEQVRAGGRWSMGDDGLLSRVSDDHDAVEVFDIEDSSLTVIPLDGAGEVDATHATRDYVYVSSDPGRRIARAVGAEWVPVAQLEFVEFAPVPGRVVSSSMQAEAVVQQLRDDGTQVTLARLTRGCGLAGQFVSVSARGGWVLWSIGSGSAACTKVGRAAIDENGNARFQPLPGISQWAQEMSDDTNAFHESAIRVVQFGQQLAFVDSLRGTIRLADEPPFVCIDPTLPCPEGAECATTRCADLSD